jgi:plastocyanin
MIGRRHLQLVAVGAMLLLSGCGAAGDGSNVTGLPKPASVKLLVPASELFVGQSIQLTATAQDDAGNDVAAGDATWSSSNAAVAMITEGGLLQAMSVGSATLTATIAGKSASMGVSVADLPSYDVTVQVNAAFAPATVTVRQYGTVHFVFSGVQQNITFSTAFPGAPADVPNTTTGTVNRQFGTVGDFRYTSSVSAGLAGLVKVR